MGQQAEAVGAAGGVAREDARGGVRELGKLALAVVAGAAVGAALFAAADRAGDGVAVQESAVVEAGNRQVAAELAREKAALLAAAGGAGGGVDSVVDAPDVLAREKAGLLARAGAVVADVDSAADVANALARDKAGVVESRAGGTVSADMANARVRADAGFHHRARVDQAATDRWASRAEHQDGSGSAGAAAAEAANQLRRAA